MTSWIVTIDAQHTGHWAIAKHHGFWDMTKYQSLAFGDLVYFWQAGGSLLSQCLVTQGSYPITPQQATPWEDSGARTYTTRFHFDVLSESPLSQPKWGLLQKPMSKKMSPQFFPRFKSIQDQARLAEFFRPSPDVEVSYEGFPTEEVGELDDDRRRIDLRAIRTRQGQQQFRNHLISAYGGCAVTGAKAIDVLEAAHISPYKGIHTNSVRNGLLLRSDIHTLFDLHLLTVTPAFDVRVHPRIHDDYESLDRRPLRIVPNPHERPHAKLLEAHNIRCSWLETKKLTEVASGSQPTESFEGFGTLFT